MLFNSLVFLVFFPVVYALYRLTAHAGQNRVLLVASYIFYGWWDWRFLALMVGSTVVDWALGAGNDRHLVLRALDMASQRRRHSTLDQISPAVFERRTVTHSTQGTRPLERITPSRRSRYF